MHSKLYANLQKISIFPVWLTQIPLQWLFSPTISESHSPTKALWWERLPLPSRTPKVRHPPRKNCNTYRRTHKNGFYTITFGPCWRKRLPSDPTPKVHISSIPQSRSLLTSGSDSECAHVWFISILYFSEFTCILNIVTCCLESFYLLQFAGHSG